MLLYSESNMALLLIEFQVLQIESLLALSMLILSIANRCDSHSVLHKYKNCVISPNHCLLLHHFVSVFHASIILT